MRNLVGLYRIFLALILSVLKTNGVSISPGSQATTVCKEVRFVCQYDDDQPPHWTHRASCAGQTTCPVASSTYVGKLERVDRRLYSLNQTTKGQSILTIKCPSYNSSGTYICTDDQGIGISASAALMVWSAAPTCKLVERTDSFVKVSCEAEYQGYPDVSVAWENHGCDEEGSKTALGGSVWKSRCNITVESGTRDPLVCYVMLDSSPQYHTNCTVDLTPVITSPTPATTSSTPVDGTSNTGGKIVTVNPTDCRCACAYTVPDNTHVSVVMYSVMLVAVMSLIVWSVHRDRRSEKRSQANFEAIFKRLEQLSGSRVVEAASDEKLAAVDENATLLTEDAEIRETNIDETLLGIRRHVAVGSNRIQQEGAIYIDLKHMRENFRSATA